MPRFAFTSSSLAWSLLRLVFLSTALLGGSCLVWGWAARNAAGSVSVPGWHHPEGAWLLAVSYGFLLVRGVRMCRRARQARCLAELVLSTWQVLPDGRLSTGNGVTT